MVSLSTVTAQFFIPALSSKDVNMLLVQVVLCAIFYVLRITKINKILAQIQEFFNLNGSLNDMVGLLKLLMTIVFIAHICGCVWHGIAHYSSSYSWLDEYGFRDADNGTRYNYSIYWATMTMTTVGYGDITGQNDREIIISILTMFVASMVFAYSVNSIGIFVSNMYKGTMEYSRTVTLINTFMSKNKIQFDLQTRIRSYIEYIWQEEQEMNDDEVGSIVKKLSKHLQDELQYQLRGNILKNCKIIVKLFSEQFLKNLLQVMEEQSYSPEEKIITVNQIDDCALYIITKGEVELIFSGKNQIGGMLKRNTIKQLRQYDCFGELAFFTENSRTATAISKGFTRVFKIKRENFLQIIQQFPNDYEKYCDVKDRLAFGDYSALQMTCYSCRSNRHLIHGCNYLHFCADQEKLIKKEQYPVNQRRNFSYSKRTKQKEPSSWIMQKYFFIRARDLTQDLYQQERIGTDGDDGDSHTMPVNDAYEEDDNNMTSEIPSSFNQQRSQSRTLSQKQPQDELEEAQKPSYLRKSYPPRPTVQTAGFGGNKKHKDGTLLNEHKMSDSLDSSEEQDEVILNPEPIRQKANEIPSKPSIKRMLSKNSNDDPPITRIPTDIKLQKHQSSIPQQKISSDIEIKHIQSREQARKITNRTRTQNEEQPTLITDNLTQINNMQAQAPTITTIVMNFDKMSIFQYYQPLNNYDVVLKRYTRAQRFFGKKRIYPESSLYSFFFLAIKKGVKLRKLGQTSSGSGGLLRNLVKAKNFQKTKRFRQPTLSDRGDIIVQVK